MLTDSDRRLLRNLQADPFAPHNELAERCAMTPAKVSRRLERLADKGILRGQSAKIDWGQLGYTVEVSLRFTLEKTNPRAFEEFLSAARQIPEVIEVQTFLGKVDIRLSVIANDMPHYQEIYRQKILTLPHIADLEALMHISTIKSASALPI